MSTYTSPPTPLKPKRYTRVTLRKFNIAKARWKREIAALELRVSENERNIDSLLRHILKGEHKARLDMQLADASRHQAGEKTWKSVTMEDFK